MFLTVFFQGLTLFLLQGGCVLINILILNPTFCCNITQAINFFIQPITSPKGNYHSGIQLLDNKINTENLQEREASCSVIFADFCMKFQECLKFINTHPMHLKWVKKHNKENKQTSTKVGPPLSCNVGGKSTHTSKKEKCIQ
jgi:hypothetical protein